MGLTLKKFEVFAHQNKFIRSTAKFPALVAGYGSGKTVAFCIKALLELGRNPSQQILLAEPTFPMVRDVLQPTLEYAINEMGFKYEHSATRGKYTVLWNGGWGDILLRSAENYIRWAGLNLAGFGLDEAALLRDDSAWKMGLGRLREGTHLCAWTTTTPEGFNWHYKYWEESPKTGYEIIRGKTFDNTYLPQEFIDSLLDNYDERLVRAYLHGEYVNLQYGQTYYNFARENNVVDNVEYDPSKPIRVGLDFNVDPMCAVLWQKYVDHPKIRVFDEKKIIHSGGTEILTQVMCDVLRDSYKQAEFVIYPDPSGVNRGTSSSLSDHAVIAKNKMKILVKRSHPSIVDSVNAVNNSMKTTVINKNCKGLIRDMEQVVNKTGTRDIDKSNKDLTHFSDGYRYSIDIEFPVHKPKMRQL